MSENNNNITTKIKELYDRGRSVSEIAQVLNCSIHKVIYWMDKIGMPRRSRSDAMYSKYNPSGDPFKISEVNSINQATLFGLGLGIYWGEGNKVTPHGLRVANTDPSMLLVFKKFLIQICGVKPNKIHYNIVCFNDSNPSDVLAYWSKVFGVSEDRFGKIVQIAPQGKGTYKHKSQYGVCTISVYNIKLKQWMMESLRVL